MSSLTLEKIKMPAGRLGKHGDYPILFKPGAFEKGGSLDETEQLFLNYGKVMHTLPYASLDDYDHSEDLREFDAYIMENENIKAVFIPSLGGRMWSLYDKKHERDLVVNNPVFRPCNLATRNAWFSGGVEWNCGVRGHHPLTCEQIYAAGYTADDGTPVLRMYAFERMRAITYQMDFFLPEGSANLYARMRLVNESDKVTPIYWWSTIAVEQKEGSRVIVPTDETYVNHGGDPVYKCRIPVIDGVDTSYPTNHTEATDHFFKIPEATRKYEAYVDAQGRGLIHASTKRLKGRKMFVWGTSQGGKNWQKILTNKDGVDYMEIQAGLAYTQNESLPFQPHSSWEWLEAYCPIEMEPEKVHCEYDTARANIMAWLDDYLPEKKLDEMLEDTKKEALKYIPYEIKGQAWGALDNEMRAANGEKAISPNLCFGELDEEQMVWHDFLKNGYLAEPDPAEPPKSFMVQDEWFDLLRRAVKKADKFNWYAWYNLGVCYYARDDYEHAGDAFGMSLSLKPSTWAYHGLACAAFSENESRDGAAYMSKALEMNRTNLQLAKEALKLCAQFKEYSQMLSMYEIMPEENRADPLIQGYYAIALAYTDRQEKAKEILEQGGGLIMPDQREGDDAVTTAYIYIVKELAKREGREVYDDEVNVPAPIDFRMFHTDGERMRQDMRWRAFTLENQC